MRSPADPSAAELPRPQGSGTRGARWREAAEWLLRIAALALIALAGWRSLQPPAATRSATLEAAALTEQLGDLSRDPSMDRVHVALDSAPSPWVRDWLAGLRRAGAAVTWSGAPTPLATSAEPVPAPGGGVRLSVAAASGVRAALLDDASAIDTIVVQGAGASLQLASLAGAGVAVVNGHSARARLVDSARLGAVMVFGRPAWETRFVIAALEEDGWRVASRVPVAPDAVVSTARIPALDTAAVSAVVVLDSTAAPFAAEIARYVRSGGGLVLHARGAGVRALAALAPARPGSVLPPPTGDSVRLEDLGGRALVQLDGRAVPVAVRGSTVLAAAQRVEHGRVLLLGVDESWRWRLGGGAEAVSAHRAWWSSLVGSVAHAPLLRVGRAETDGADAPLAALVAVLGAPSTAPAGEAGYDSGSQRALLLPLLILLLSVTAWWSRRLRGAP